MPLSCGRPGAALLCPRDATHPDRLRRHLAVGWLCAGRSLRRSRRGLQCTLIVEGVTLLSAGQSGATLPDCHPGGGASATCSPGPSLCRPPARGRGRVADCRCYLGGCGCNPVARSALILCCRREAGPRLGRRWTGSGGPGMTCSRTAVRSASSRWFWACGRGGDSDMARAGPHWPGPAADPDGINLGPAGRGRRKAILFSQAGAGY